MPWRRCAPTAARRSAAIPATKEQEITVDSGSAEFNRGNEHLDIAQWQRVTFPTGGKTTTSQVLAPPDLLEPLNLQPIIVADPKHDPVHFSWKPASTAKLYDFQASTTAMFNRVVAEKKVAATSVDVAGLDPGDYFWRVRAIDEQNKLSDAGDAHKFTLVAQGKEQEMLLEVDNTELQGNVVEVIGRTEPGAALIINGEASGRHSAQRTFPLFHPADVAGQPPDRDHRPESPRGHGDQAGGSGNSVAA